MAKLKHTTPAPSSTSMASLGPALSRSRLSRPDGFRVQKSLCQPLLMTVLIIYTGGTIGMIEDKGGNAHTHLPALLYTLLYSVLCYVV